MDLEKLLFEVLKISEKAGKEIKKVYESEFAVEHKEDKSPLTEADKRSHDVIQKGLECISNFPILSEEGKDIPYGKRKNWEYFWMVDPLDGTKEFIKKNGEFTVNVALIQKNKPILGVVYAPILNTFYFGAENIGSYKLVSNNLENLNSFEEILKYSIKLPIEKENKKITVVASRSHMSEETKDFIEKLKERYGEIELKSIGSSLKICLVAEGEANFYPRLAPTMEWDTAAAHAIVNSAMGRIVEFKDVINIKDIEKLPDLKYNKKNLLNPWFVVYRTI